MQVSYAPPARLSWLRAVPALAPHVVRTMPWVTVLAGCAGGTALLDLTAHVVHASHGAVNQNTMRFTFLSAIAALAFVPRAPFRPIRQTVPVPSATTSAGHILLSLPPLAATCRLQLRIVDASIPARLAHGAIYPLLAQLTAWTALAIAAATCVERSRYEDLGGGLAAPLTVTIIGALWFAPFLKEHLVAPPASPHSAVIVWYAVAAITILVTWFALRDPWRRYTKQRGRRPRPAAVPCLLPHATQAREDAVTAIVVSTEVDRPAADVFAYATDPTRFDEWQDGVVSGHLQTSAEPKVGDLCVMTRRIGGAERASTSRLTHIDTPRTWGVRGIDGPVRATVEVTVEPLAESRSKVTVSVDFEGHGLGKVLVPLVVRRQAAKEMPGNVARLKTRLET